MASYLVYESHWTLEYLGAAAAWCGTGGCSTNSTVKAEGNRAGSKLVRDGSSVRLVDSCIREQWARRHHSPKRGRLFVLQAGNLGELDDFMFWR